MCYYPVKLHWKQIFYRNLFWNPFFALIKDFKPLNSEAFISCLLNLFYCMFSYCSHPLLFFFLFSILPRHIRFHNWYFYSDVITLLPSLSQCTVWRWSSEENNDNAKRMVTCQIYFSGSIFVVHFRSFKRPMIQIVLLNLKKQQTYMSDNRLQAVQTQILTRQSPKQYLSNFLKDWTSEDPLKTVCSPSQ